MAAFREHELATTTDGIIHFVFLSAQIYSSFEAFLHSVILTDAAAIQCDWADKPGWWISMVL